MAMFRQSVTGRVGLALSECPKTKIKKHAQQQPSDHGHKTCATECHLMQPHTKSMAAQIEKKSGALRRFIRQPYGATRFVHGGPGFTEQEANSAPTFWQSETYSVEGSFLMSVLD